jgi:hypothetical protein
VWAIDDIGDKFMPVQASRKFDELVRFYKLMMRDAKSEKVRMDAATQLDALWARQQHYAERAAARKERLELRKTGLGKAVVTVAASDANGEGEVSEAEQRELSEQEVFDKVLGLPLAKK